MEGHATKWGIISVGKIAKDFVMARKTLNPGDHTIVAVAARDHDRAKAFAEEFGINKSYGHHEDMAFDKDVGMCIRSHGCGFVKFSDQNFVCSAKRKQNVPQISYYWTVPLILDRSYLVGKINKFKNF
jgi:hypothetical protein